MNDDVKMYYIQSQFDIYTCYEMDKLLHHKPYHIICFHAQQAAEKCLKALILANNIVAKNFRTHDIGDLIQMLQGVYADVTSFYDKADILTQFGVQTRYEPTEGYGETESKLAIVYAQDICAWAEMQLSILAPEVISENKFCDTKP